MFDEITAVGRAVLGLSVWGVQNALEIVKGLYWSTYTHSVYDGWAFVGEPEICVLKYHTCTGTKLDVSRKDMRTLLPGHHLNDTVIELGLSVAYDALKKDDPFLASGVYIFNTYFFTNLINPNYGYKSLSKWLKNVDIFLYSQLIIPIHQKHSDPSRPELDHWWLAIVTSHACMRDVPLGADEHSRYVPTFLSLDPLGRDHTEELQLIYDFLSKKSSDQLRLIPVLPANRCRFQKILVPLQPNGHDCGLFLINNVDIFLTHLSEWTDAINNNPSRAKLRLWNAGHYHYTRNSLCAHLIRLSPTHPDFREVIE